ncbi:MAG: response regulator, partial [Syntrophaceae bacterium]|nr:response regulator [Syntrophaceae bacterium]
MEEKLRILHVEDLDTDAELIKREIAKSGIQFIYKIVETKDEYVKAIHEFKPDIILSDYTLPLFNGMQAILIREELAKSTPFILITGTINEETAVAVMKAGADDYLIKEHLTRIGEAI